MPVAAVEQVDATDAHRSQRIAVIRVADAEKQVAVFGTFCLLPVVLVSHLECDFDRGGAAV